MSELTGSTSIKLLGDFIFINEKGETTFSGSKDGKVAKISGEFVLTQEGYELFGEIEGGILSGSAGMVVENDSGLVEAEASVGYGRNIDFEGVELTAKIEFSVEMAKTSNGVGGVTAIYTASVPVTVSANTSTEYVNTSFGGEANLLAVEVKVERNDAGDIVDIAIDTSSALDGIFSHGDGNYDPVGGAIAELHEQFPSIPLDVLATTYVAALIEHEEVYAGGTIRSVEAGVSQLKDPEFSNTTALMDNLAAADHYYETYVRTTLSDPGSTETLPPPTNNNNDKDKDKDPDPTVEAVPEPTDPTAPSPGETWVDSTTGDTHVQDSPTIQGHGTQAPVILDLDGDGIEVAFGEAIYFDTDGDGFQEQTSWAAADDGFLVRDLGMDGVIDQAEELAL